MDFFEIKTENDYLDYIEKIKSVSKNESVNDLKRHKSILNTNQEVIGVAMANIRKIAKQIFKGGYESFLEISLQKNKDTQTYEETLIEGLVISQIEKIEQLFGYLDKWIVKIDNWSTCDSVTSSFKKLKMSEKYFDWFYEKCFSKQEFVSRFGITILMNNYLDKKYLNKLFYVCDEVKNDAYYVKMAKAWLLSFCFIKYKNETIKYFKNNKLDKFTHNKAISKCRESFQVSAEDKEFLKILRIK